MERPQHRREALSLRLAGHCAALFALAICGVAVAQPARASEGAPGYHEQSPLHARSWSKLDLAIDRAERTSGLVGTRCMPHGSPGSTLLTDSKRLTGLELKRVATRALKSREFVALDSALRARGFHAMRSKPYGRASVKEKLTVVPYLDSRGRGAYAGLLEGSGKRRAEARFANVGSRALSMNRSTLVVDGNTRPDSPLTARAAALDPLCLRICLQGAARCRLGINKCIPLLGAPFGGAALFGVCAAAICGPDTLRCIRACL